MRASPVQVIPMEDYNTYENNRPGGDKSPPRAWSAQGGQEGKQS